MDPNQALADLRAALAKAQEAADGDSNDAEIEAWQDVGEYFEALDQWLSRDGFLPTDWMAEEDKPAPDPDTAACVAAGAHQRATRHRWQECPVYHEGEN